MPPRNIIDGLAIGLGGIWLVEGLRRMPQHCPTGRAPDDRPRSLWPLSPAQESGGIMTPLTPPEGPDPSGFDRIRFAVLKLSHGNLQLLRRGIDFPMGDM